MSRRSHAYLDLAAEPAIGSALLDPAPVLLYAPDARRILFANAAGCEFMGEAEMARLLDRPLSAALPATETIARFARSVPLGAGRLERIRFQSGGRLESLPARCTRVMLPDGESGVLVTLAPPRGAVPPVDVARRLTAMLAATDCLVAVLDAEGGRLAEAGTFEALAAGDAAIEQLAGAMSASRERLLKRVVRIDGLRRPAGMVRFESAGIVAYLMILGPAERVEIEPPAAAEPPGRPPATVVPLVPPQPPTVTADDEAWRSAAAALQPIPAAGEGGEGTPREPEEGREPSVPVPDLRRVASGPDRADAVETTPDEAPAVESVPPADAGAQAPETVAAEPEVPAVPPSPPAVAYRFSRPGGPVRFVFQMDADTRFTFVSPELAAIVGPRSADIVGRSWADVAAERRLDAAGTVAAILARRDTWSGVTLAWPADGGADQISVDLAALPAFSRDRRFEGYRGFGVIRPAENGRAAVQPPAAAAVPSNVVRLPRAVALVDEERLSPPEQEAFRRIAAALGAPAPQRAEPPADAAPEAEVAPAAAPEPVASQPAASEPATAEPAAPERADAPAPPPAPAADDSGRADAAGQKIVELEAILDTATDGILIIDGDGRIERINRSAEALFGVESSAVAGLAFTDLLAEESRKLALDYLDGLARNGVASVLNDGREVIGRVPQGGLIPLFMTMGRLPVAGRFCAVLRDITQWKNAEEELVSAKRAAENASTQKSEFLAKISHEIRTPLNAIIGFSEVMMEERFGPIGSERYKEYLRDIHVSGAHLMSLINDLLDLSKIEAGKLDLAFQAVALNDIVMECVAVMQPQANRERIIIRTSLSSEVPNIVADARSLRQIVLNLLSNAVKFTLAGGQVIVSTAMEPHGEVTLRIRDTGVGMSEKDIETALKPFRQLAVSRERRSDGTGLGLPLTKALVEANRAAFAIDSTVGQGTLVRVTFPATRVLAG